jgi:hypothetical protein
MSGADEDTRPRADAGFYAEGMATSPLPADPAQWELVPVIATVPVAEDTDVDALGTALVEAIFAASAVIDDAPPWPMCGNLYRLPHDPVVEAGVVLAAHRMHQPFPGPYVNYGLALGVAAGADRPDWEHLLVRARDAMQALLPDGAGHIAVLPIGREHLFRIAASAEETHLGWPPAP